MVQNVTNGATKLNERQLAALPYIAAGRTTTEGAELADISRTTLYRWIEDDDFRRELERLRDEAVELAHTELKGLMFKATLVLNLAMDDPNPFVRLKAAQIALSAHLKANELRGIERRLDRMEDALPLWSQRNRI